MNLSMIIIPVYLVVITLIIVVLGRKVKTYKDFAVAGGKLPWFVVAGTILATCIGGGTLMGYVGSFYTYGMQWAWMAIGVFIANLLMTFVFSGKINVLGQYTLPDILNKRYGRKTRLAGAIIVFLGEFAVVCAMMASFAAMLSGYVGISQDIAMIIGLVLFILTASLGGLIGVAYTDAIQAVLIIFGVIVVGAVAFVKSGGFTGFASLEPSMTSLLSENIPRSTMFGNVIALMGLSLVSQSIYFQRINACKNAKEAKKAVGAFTVLNFICVFFFIAAMGLGAYKLLGPGINGNLVIGKLLATNLPPVIASLYAAAIISAVLTTANSLLLSNSMNVARDIYQELKKDATDKELLRVSKIYIVVGTVIAFFIVKFYPSIIGLILFAYTIQACLIVPLYIGLYWKKPTPVSGFLSIIIGGVGTLIWQILKSPFGIHAVFIGIALALVGLIIGFYVGEKATKEQLEIVDMFKNSGKKLSSK